ncbi:unnamed protein product [Phaeothamnion confervicola]
MATADASTGAGADPQCRPASEEALRRVVREELHSFRADIQRAVADLHLDMLRQFQAQQDDLATFVVASGESIRRLDDENTLLRAEVAALRRQI